MTQYFDAIKIHDQLLKLCVLDLIPSDHQPCHICMYNDNIEMSADNPLGMLWSSAAQAIQSPALANLVTHMCGSPV